MIAELNRDLIKSTRPLRSRGCVESYVRDGPARRCAAAGHRQWTLSPPFALRFLVAKRALPQELTPYFMRRLPSIASPTFHNSCAAVSGPDTTNQYSSVVETKVHW